MEWRDGVGGMHFVYEVRTADDELLYIGCTGNPARRGKELSRGKFGWVCGARIEVVAAFASRRDAYEHENQRIKRFQPPHNRQGVAPGLAALYRQGSDGS